MDSMDNFLFNPEGWPSNPDDFLDSIFSMNGDLLTEFEEPNAPVPGNLNDITSSIINNLHNNFSQNNGKSLSPISSLASDQEFQSFGSTQQNIYDTDIIMMNVDLDDDVNVFNPVNMYDIKQEQALSSSASDSGLSSDHLDLDLSPDYEALSPALSSPGPSISERGGQNSPPRFKQQIVRQPKVMIQQTLPTPQTVTKTVKARQGNNGKKTQPKVIVEKVQSEYDGLMFNKDQPQIANNKEVKIYRMTPTKTAGGQTVNYVSTNGANKKVTLQLKNNNTASKVAANTVILNNKNLIVPQNNGGVRKVIRVQQQQPQQQSPQNSRSILLPVSIQDIKDLRTIKIVNSSNLKNKSANIKLAAANLLHQSKQGLVQKNVVFSKEQLMTDDSLSDVTQNSDCESYVFEDIMQQSNSVIEAVARQRSNSDSEGELDDDDDNISESGNIGANGNYQKLLLTTEEKRLLSKEGITLPTNYPLTKHEERELKRIRRKIRNKISAQDSRKRKKEYVDGLEERVKQCTEENQTLLKRIKILQTQNHDLMSQMKKIQSLLTKGTHKTTQPATCLMVLLLSMALVAVPNLKLNGTSQQQNIQDSIELAEIMQESNVQNRRSLLFDTKEQLGDALVEEEMNFDDIMSFNVNTLIANEHDYSEEVHYTEEPQPKKMKLFVDYDVDDEVWNDKTKSRIKLEGEHDNEAFKREAQAYQESLLKNMQSSGFNIKTEMDDESNIIFDKDILDLVSKNSNGLYELNLETFSSLTKDPNNIEIISIDQQYSAASTNGNHKLNSSQQFQQQNNQKKLLL